MSGDKGIIYVATKDERFALEAFLSATSVKDLMPDIPITLFTNLEDSVFVRDDCFDNIVPIDSVRKYSSAWSEGTLDRMMCLKESPYKYTLNLDTDTRVLSDEVADIFSLLDDFDIALVECENDNSFSRLHYGSRMFNVGFVLFRKCEKTTRLFDAWSELTAEHFRVASKDEVPELECITHIDDPEMRKRLLLIDQVAFVQLLSPGQQYFRSGPQNSSRKLELQGFGNEPAAWTRPAGKSPAGTTEFSGAGRYQRCTPISAK